MAIPIIINGQHLQNKAHRLARKKADRDFPICFFVDGIVKTNLLPFTSNPLSLYMMVKEQKNNPLHGLTLEFIVKQLFFHYGWEEMGNLIKIDCFKNNPSLKSSLKFLRKTDWARKKVEKLYLNTFH